MAPIARVALVLVLLATLAVPAAAKLPRSITLATNPPGTVYYTFGSGLAKVISGGPFQVSIQPYAGSSTFLPLLNTGEVELGIVNAVDMGLSYRGPKFQIGGRNPFPHPPHHRPVMLRPSPLVGVSHRHD